MNYSRLNLKPSHTIWEVALGIAVITTASAHSLQANGTAPAKTSGKSARPVKSSPAKTPVAQATPPLAAVPDAAEQRMFLERSREEHNARVVWQPVTTMTFDNAAVLQQMRVIDGRWEIAGGQLQAVGGEADGNRTLLLAPSLPGPMRLEFDATLFARPDGRIGDIAIRLNADPVTGSFERGYAFIPAQYWNQATVCYKLNIPIARTEWSPVVPGQRHRIVVEWTDMHLRLFLDGKIVLDAWDRDNPLPYDATKWIGISTYDTRMAIDNFTISTVAPAANSKAAGQ